MRDHVNCEVRKPIYELLAIAKRIGDAAVLFIGGADKANDFAEWVKANGAEKVQGVDGT